MIVIYLKIHNKSGFKYLGKTERDPFSYNGSGVIWNRHIKKYGKDITTKILGEFETLEEARECGIYYSRLWNIVESSNFANLMEENCNGAGKNRKFTKSHKNNLSLSHVGEKHSLTRRQKVSSKKKNVPLSDFHKEALKVKKRKKALTKCPICGMESKYSSVINRHLKNLHSVYYSERP